MPPHDIEISEFSNDFAQWGSAAGRRPAASAQGQIQHRMKPPLSAWELHDFAVQVVRADLEKAGREVTFWQNNPDVDPSIWFVGDSGPEWLVVRPAAYPDDEAPLPAHLPQIRQSCARQSLIGHFASVSIVCLGDCLSQDEIPTRGYRLMTNYCGLRKL